MGKKDIVPGSASLEDFWYWINERHRIYVNRFVKGLPKPWSEDPIFLDYKFTNVFRELDRGTLALRGMLEDRWYHDPALTAFNIIWYRLLNRAEHAQESSIGWVEDIDYLVDAMRDIERRDLPLFTSAHLTVGIGGEAKIDSYIRTFRRIWDMRKTVVEWCIQGKTLEAVWEDLQVFECIGGFIAYEIVSDFRHYGFLLADAYDMLEWANLGPGCKRGLLRLGLPFCQESLRWLYELAYDAGAPPLQVGDPDGSMVTYEWENAQVPAGLEPHVLVHHVKHARFNEEAPRRPWFELREIEHSLCEFDKYQRVKTGVGKPRQRYEGRP